MDQTDSQVRSSRGRGSANLTAPSGLQRVVEAPTQWHCRRLPSRLARFSSLEGDSRARKKAEEEERLRWAGEVADLILALSTTTAERAHKTTDPRLSAMRMCSNVRAADGSRVRQSPAPFLAMVGQPLKCCDEQGQLCPSARRRLVDLSRRDTRSAPSSANRQTCLRLHRQEHEEAWQTHAVFLAAVAELPLTKATSPALQRFLAVHGSMGSAQVLRPQGTKRWQPAD